MVVIPRREVRNYLLDRLLAVEPRAGLVHVEDLLLGLAGGIQSALHNQRFDAEAKAVKAVGPGGVYSLR